MNILAIDPATKCGWATDTAGGVWDLSIRRDESGGMRLIRLKAKLLEVVKACSINVVVFEAARNAKASMQGALVVQAELQSVIKTVCEELGGVEYRGYSPAELKKHATGKGNSNKAAMVEAATVKWPHIAIEDDNHADALWLLDLAKKELTRS